MCNVNVGHANAKVLERNDLGSCELSSCGVSNQGDDSRGLYILEYLSTQSGVLVTLTPRCLLASRIRCGVGALAVVSSLGSSQADECDFMHARIAGLSGCKIG